MERFLPAWFGSIFAAVIILAAANGMTIFYLSTLRQRAEAVQVQAQICKQLGEEIESLKNILPTQPSGSDSAEDNFVAPIREYLRDCGIEEHQIASIGFRGRTPIRKTAFERLDSNLTLTSVTMDRLLQFINDFEKANSESVCSSIDLTALPTLMAADRDQWNVDLVLTRLVLAGSNAP